MNFIIIGLGILMYTNQECTCFKNIPMGELVSQKIGILETFKKNFEVLKAKASNPDNEDEMNGINNSSMNGINNSLNHVNKTKRDVQPEGHMDGYYRGPWANAYQRPSVHQFMLANRPIHYATRDPEHVRFHTLDEAPEVPKGLPTADQEFVKLHYESRNEQLPKFKPPTKLTPGSLATFDGDIKKPGPHYSFESKYPDA